MLRSTCLPGLTLSGMEESTEINFWRFWRMLVHSGFFRISILALAMFLVQEGKSMEILLFETKEMGTSWVYLIYFSRRYL